MHTTRAILRSGRTVVKHSLLRTVSIACRLGRRAGDAVLLTFDDGPHPEVTPGVLDRLERYGVRAIFFVVGSRIPLAPWTLAEILRAGHVIGNHTYHHDYRNRDFPGYIEDIELCQGAVEALAGVRPALFRPPLGRVTLSGLRAAWHHRLRTVHWSIDSGDWALRSRDAAQACGDRLGRLVGPGDIVLLHDDNPCVLTVLDVLLPTLAGRGLDLGRAARHL